MVSNRRGFTLVEILMATFILTSGMVAVAWVFAYSAKAAANNQQRMVATLLLQEKLEQLKSTSLDNAIWASGEYSDHSGEFLRSWRITGETLRSVTIIVYADRASLANTQMEMARGSTMRSP